MAAPTNIYVDPAITANSGAGTIGDPYGDLQWALDHVARDATNGNQINIKAGTAEVLAASLALTTYGTPAEGAPLILRGYTATAGDGGIAEINCNGVPLLASNATTDLGLVELKIHNGGNADLVRCYGARSFMFRCEVYRGASTPTSKVLVWQLQTVIGCYVHDAGTGGTGIADAIVVAYGNYVYNCPTGFTCANATGTACIVKNILVDCATGILAEDATAIIGNTIYCSTANTGKGISVPSGKSNATILNNVIEGYSGADGVAISGVADIALYGYNAFYNNTAGKSIADCYVDLANDVTCGVSPFTAASSGNFAVTTELKAKGFPAAWYGPAGTTNYQDIGAVQRQEAAAGGVHMPRVRIGH